MKKGIRRKSLYGAYRFEGFKRQMGRAASPDRAAQAAHKKTVCGCCVHVQMGWYDEKKRWVRDKPCGDYQIYLAVDIYRVDCRKCKSVKREKVDWFLDSPFCTKRFGKMIGRKVPQPKHQRCGP